MRTEAGLDKETLDRLGTLYKNTYLEGLEGLVEALAELKADPLDSRKLFAVHRRCELMYEDFIRYRVMDTHNKPLPVSPPGRVE